jgi:nucleoside-diphosphate-sugar epimerase
MRFATVFGISGRPRFDLILNQFAYEAMIEHKLTVYGEQAWRSHVHVSDLAYDIGLLLEYPLLQGAQIINVGGYNRTKADLVRVVRHFAEFEYTTADRGPDPRDYKVSFEKARSWGLIALTTPEMGILEVCSALSTGIMSNPGDRKYRNG